MKKIICVCIIMLSCFTFSSVFASNTFYDTRGTKYEGVVERMSKLEIINGMNETTFAPNKNVTRAELAKIIVKMKGIEDFANDVEYKKTFSDVKKNDWYYPYVLIAADLELVNGYQDGTFRPNQPVTYAELATIFLRYLGYTNISQDSPNGWYWNYIVRMRQIELNDNVGEFDYTKPAKRGDVAMFAWNALITDRWAISFENEKEGLTYTYSQKAPLEMYFEDYKFIDNQIVRSVIGYDGKPGIIVDGKVFYTQEKVPLYVLGGTVTGLYMKNSEELIGVTFDEDNADSEIISGPIFYLEEEGYRLERAKNVAYYGSKNKATYAFVIEGEDKKNPERVVYLDGTNTIYVEKIAVKAESGDDDELIEKVELNEEEFTSMNSALVESGFGYSWTTLKAGDFITNLGKGLYVKNTKNIEDVISDLKREDGEFEIWLDEDKYIILEECLCYKYGNKDAVTIDSLDLEDYIGTESKIYLNVAEEVYKIEFGKTTKDNERYVFGYITDVINYKDTTKQSIDVNVTPTREERYKFDNGGKTYFLKGDFVAVGKANKEDSSLECIVLDKDNAFDNDISVKYDYDAKVIKSPMIGEYMVTKNTEYYKVNLKYEKNSTSKIENCNVEKLKLDDLEDLLAYKIHLVYDENMEILKVYAINEINKFENQVALVKDKKRERTAPEEYIYNVSLSITEDIVTAFEMEEEEEFLKYNVGNIITFATDEDNSEKIKYVEEFKHEFIGYKRDLVVNNFEPKTNSIIFTDGTKMNLDEDVYTWNNKKINLNNYRFVIAKVYKDGDYWNFASLKMQEKENLKVEKNDRFAIGEINDVIVIYRGYEE